MTQRYLNLNTIFKDKTISYHLQIIIIDSSTNKQKSNYQTIVIKFIMIYFH